MSEQVRNISLRLGIRRRIDGRLADLLAAPDPAAAERESLLAGGSDLLVMLARRLETGDPEAISRLGALAADYPDRPAAVALLRREALSPRNSDLKRMATMVVLQQFLGADLGPEFFITLRDPAQVATDSLVHVLAGADDRNLLLAYLSALEEQQPAALGAVLDSLWRLSDAQAIEVAKLLTQHQDPNLAGRARARLAALRTPVAVEALRVLEFVTPPERQEQARRALRKLALAGAPLPPFPAPPAGARALLTGLDAGGVAAIWFLTPAREGEVALLSLLVSDARGIVDAFGGDSFSVDSFPPPGEIGSLHAGAGAAGARRGGWRSSFDRGAFRPAVDGTAPDAEGNLEQALAAAESDCDFLEIPFETGRRMVAEYQALNWERGVPLPWEYRLLHDIIWRYGPPPPRPRGALRPARPGQDTRRLFSAPYFAGWRLDGPRVQAAAGECRALEGGALPDDLQECARRLAAAFSEDDRRAYAARLRRSVEWLQLAGDLPAARLALRAALDLKALPPTSNPFILGLAERGIHEAARHARGAARVPAHPEPPSLPRRDWRPLPPSSR
jgi:hypothetical protein